MHPTLITFGPVIVHTANFLYVFAWLIFSFLFWRSLRSEGILEERIFDLTFYGTLVGLVVARLGFVFLYPNLFSPSILLIGAFWVQGGVWVYSGLLGVILMLWWLSKRYGVLFSHVFDAFVVALPWAALPMLLGIFFQGGEIGKITSVPWSIRMTGVEGLRHPVQLYEFAAVFVVAIISLFIRRLSVDRGWASGLLGVCILSVLTPVLFVLEFFKAGQIYLYGISVNQWLLIGVFAESAGSLIIKGKVIRKLSQIKGGMNERFDTRFHRNNSSKVSERKESDSDTD